MLASILLNFHSDGSGSKQFLTRVGSDQFFVAWVGSAIYCLGLNWENLPTKHQIFQSFRVVSKSTQVEGESASYLLRVKSKLGSGQGQSLNFQIDKFILYI